MREVWRRWAVVTLMIVAFSVGMFGLAQPADGALDFNAPATTVGTTICNAAVAMRTLLGGAIVAVVFIIGVIMFLAGNSRSGFGFMVTGLIGGVLLATMPTWIGGLINGCAI